MSTWLDHLQKKNKRKIGQAISLVENGSPLKNEILSEILSAIGNAYIIGVTGPPGSGKSPLLDGLITYLRSIKKTVGVIAVDPSSPFTGGSLLGDRIRMNQHALDQGVFIRSLGSRHNSGGLSRATREVIHILDAAKFDVIFIETVGVGQGELDIMKVADTVALVLTPGAGDKVQIYKAGIMEIASIFIINKGDLPGAESVLTQVEEYIHVMKHKYSWQPKPFKTVATAPEGYEFIWRELLKHYAFLDKQQSGEQRRENRLLHEVQDWAEYLILKKLRYIFAEPMVREQIRDLIGITKVPSEVAKQWMKTYESQEAGLSKDRNKI